ncbi:MAG: carbohydrate porin [Fuerstiella sp.]
MEFRSRQLIVFFTASLALLGDLSGLHSEEPNYDDVFTSSDDWLMEGDCGESASVRGETCSPGKGNGITFKASMNQVYQGVVDGGAQHKWRYGGSGRYDLTADLGRFGLPEGLSIRAVGEHRFGQTVTRDAGVLLPLSVDISTPTPLSEDLILVDLLVSQVVNENITIMAGKLDTFDGDLNPFASGRGRTGFMNTSLLFPANAVPIVPYSTLGAGAVFSMEGQPFASVLVLNANDTTRTSGLSELFNDGAVIYGSIALPLPLGGKTGFHSFNYAYNTKDFTALGQDPRVITGRVPVTPTTGGWVAWWSGTQFIQQFDPKNDPMKGWGLFGRYGVSDDEVTPVVHFANAGLGGNSTIHGRSNDRWGVGWFYSQFSDNLGPIATTLLNVGDHTTGIELFYNFAITEHIYITPDLQIVKPGRQGADTATILGVRGEIRI